MSTAKILAVDDEPDFEALLTQRFRRQIRDREFSFRFAHHGEEALTWIIQCAPKARDTSGGRHPSASPADLRLRMTKSSA
jgi:hypothetical protein